MERIAIISDTHNRIPEELPGILLDCDRIIHAGDICEPRILWELECIRPLTAVLGNNDHADFGPSVHPVADVEYEGVRFVVCHEPRHLAGALQSRLGNPDEGSGPVVAVHGHTHVPKMEDGEGKPYDMLICPDALNRSREAQGRKTYALVDVEDGRIIDAGIYSLSGERIF